MNPTELYKSGQLAKAIDGQLAEVRSNAADMARRLFLVELLVFSGDLELAKKQLDLIEYPEIERMTALINYKKLIDAEQNRRKWFMEGLKPMTFGDVPEHVTMRMEACDLLRTGKPAEAGELIAKANAAFADRTGSMNGKDFDAFRDADDLLAGVLEVAANGQYYWVPIDQIEAVAVAPPKFPRDLYWLPARLELAESTGEVFLPTLYPFSHDHADEGAKLGRMTDWTGPETGPARGIGLKVFIAGENDYPLPEWRELKFNI